MHTVQQHGMVQHALDKEDSEQRHDERASFLRQLDQLKKENDVFRKQGETSEISRQLLETQIASKDRELAALTRELERVNGEFLEASALSPFSQERKEDSERLSQLNEENNGLHDQQSSFQIHGRNCVVREERHNANARTRTRTGIIARGGGKISKHQRKTR